MVKVYALKDNVKRDIKYPTGQIGFDENGESDWPMDQFTQRRIRDGDISLEPPQKRVEQKAERSAKEPPKT
jgi:hypothetical protein